MYVEDELLLWNEFHSLEDLRDDLEDAVRQYSETLTTSRRQWHLRRSSSALRPSHLDPNSRNVALARSNQQVRTTAHVLDTLTISFLESRLYPISPVHAGNRDFDERGRLSSDRSISVPSSETKRAASSTAPQSIKNGTVREDVKGNILKMGALVEDLDGTIYHVFEEVVRSLDARYGYSGSLANGGTLSTPDGSLPDSDSRALDFLRNALGSRTVKTPTAGTVEPPRTASKVDRQYCLAKLHELMVNLKTYSGGSAEQGEDDGDAADGWPVEEQVSQLANSVDALHDYAHQVLQPSLNVLDETLYKVEECLGVESFSVTDGDTSSLSSSSAHRDGQCSPEMSFADAVAFLIRFRRKILIQRRSERKRIIAQRPPSSDPLQHSDPFGPLRLAAAPSNGIFSPKPDLLLSDHDQRNYVALRVETDRCVEVIAASSTGSQSSSNIRKDESALDYESQTVHDALRAVRNEKMATQDLLQFLHDTNYKLLSQQHDDTRQLSRSQSARSSVCSPPRARSHSTSLELSPRCRSSAELIPNQNGKNEVKTEDDIREHLALKVIRNSLRSNHAVLSQQLDAALHFGSQCTAWLAPLKEFYASIPRQTCFVGAATLASIDLAQKRIRNLKRASQNLNTSSSTEDPSVEGSVPTSRRESSEVSSPEPRPPLFFKGTVPLQSPTADPKEHPHESDMSAQGGRCTSVMYDEEARCALQFLRSYSRWDSSVTVSALIPGSPLPDHHIQSQAPAILLSSTNKSTNSLAEDKSMGDVKVKESPSSDEDANSRETLDSMYGLCVRCFNQTLSAFFELWTTCRVPRAHSPDAANPVELVEDVDVSRESFFGVWRREVLRGMMGNLFHNRWQADALLIVLFSSEDAIRETLDSRLRVFVPALFVNSGNTSASEPIPSAEPAPNAAADAFVSHLLRDPLISEGYQSYIPGFKRSTSTPNTSSTGATASIYDSPHFTHVIYQETTRLILSVYGFLSLYQGRIQCGDNKESGEQLETLDVSLNFEPHQLATPVRHLTAVSHINKQWEAFMDAIWFQYDPVGSANAGCMVKVETGDAAHNYGFLSISRITLYRSDSTGSSECLRATLHYAIQPEHGGAGRTLHDVFSQSTNATPSREPSTTATSTSVNHPAPLKRGSTRAMHRTSRVVDSPLSATDAEPTDSSSPFSREGKPPHTCGSSLNTRFAFLRRVLDTFSKLEQRRLWHLQHLYQCKLSDVSSYSLGEFVYVICFPNLRSNKRCSFSDPVLKSVAPSEADTSNASFSRSAGHSASEAVRSPLKTALSRRAHTFVGLVPPPAIRLLRESCRESKSGAESDRFSTEPPLPLTAGVLIADMLQEAAECDDPPLSTIISLANSLRTACMAQLEEDRLRSVDSMGRFCQEDPSSFSMKPLGQKWLVEPLLRYVDELISCDFHEEMILAGAEEMESFEELGSAQVTNPLGNSKGTTQTRRHPYPDSPYSLPLFIPQLSFALYDNTSSTPKSNRRVVARDSPHANRHMSLFSSGTFPSISTYTAQSGTSSYSVSQSTIASAHGARDTYPHVHTDQVVHHVKRKSLAQSREKRSASFGNSKMEVEKPPPATAADLHLDLSGVNGKSSPRRVVSRIPAKLSPRTRTPPSTASKVQPVVSPQTTSRSLEGQQRRGRTGASPQRMHQIPSSISRGLSRENRQPKASHPRTVVPKLWDSNPKDSPRKKEETVVLRRSVEHSKCFDGYPGTSTWKHAYPNATQLHGHTQLPTFASNDCSEGTGVLLSPGEEGIAESHVLVGDTTPSTSQLISKRDGVEGDAMHAHDLRMHSPPARPPAMYFEKANAVDRGRSPVVNRSEPLSKTVVNLSPRTQKHTMMCTMMLPNSIRRSDSPLAREPQSQSQSQPQHTRSASGRIIIQSNRHNTPRGGSPHVDNSTPRNQHPLQANTHVVKKPVWPKSAVVRHYSPASVYASQSADAMHFSVSAERVGRGDGTSRGYSADRYQDLPLSP